MSSEIHITGGANTGRDVNFLLRIKHAPTKTIMKNATAHDEHA